MVDPDGTLDALASLGLTSPLTDLQRVSPGAAGPSSVGHPTGGSSGEGPSSSTLSAPSGGPSSGASGTSTQVAERDLGLHVDNNLPSIGGEQNCVVHK